MKSLILKIDDAQNIANYLGTRPYNEVHSLITILQTSPVIGDEQSLEEEVVVDDAPKAKTKGQ